MADAKVVGHEDQRRFDNRPLSGRRVLDTRASEQANDLSRLLAAAGAVPLEVSAIRIEPPASWEEMDRAIAELERYAWVVFTSANGVRSFCCRLAARGRNASALGQTRVAAIGSGTARALRDAGIHADLVPGEYVAESLAATLVERGVAGARVLLARAAEAREVLVTELRRHGAAVDEVVAYRTVKAEDSGRRLQRLLDGDGLDAATFTSASTVRHTLAMLGEGDRERFARLAIACIGPITADAARELGLRVDALAREHTIPGLVRALEMHFSDRKERE